MNVDLGHLEMSVARDRIVINLGELTGNIWLVDLEERYLLRRRIQWGGKASPRLTARALLTCCPLKALRLPQKQTALGSIADDDISPPWKALLDAAPAPKCPQSA